MPVPDEFACTMDPSLGWAFGCSRTGAAHIRAGRPCEDAYSLWSSSAGAEPFLACAVADGHGDIRHDLSRIGSSLAVEAATGEMAAFCRMYAGGDIPRQQFRAGFKADLPRRITRRWRELVTEDAGRRIQGGAPGQDRLFTRYGTTLITALIVNNSLLFAQIGDGDLVLVRPDGSVEFPLPPDPVVAGNETHSLSATDAHLLWRTATIDRGKGGVLLVATDGVSDSFAGAESEEFSVFVKSLADRIRTYGTEAVAKAMAGWLDRYSAMASGDDMTLVWACIHPEKDTPQGPAGSPVSPAEGW